MVKIFYNEKNLLTKKVIKDKILLIYFLRGQNGNIAILVAVAFNRSGNLSSVQHEFRYNF